MNLSQSCDELGLSRMYPAFDPLKKMNESHKYDLHIFKFALKIQRKFPHHN